MMLFQRFFNSILFALTLACSTLLLSSPALAKPMQTIAGNSPNDKNQYAYLTLPNKLTVILVSDPDAERPAAAMAVNAGNFEDPNEHPGIAHLLEHMLFLGTEKYPEAGGYQAFVRQHGGTHNAYTSSQLTNYYFDILPEAYPEALDRFAQFFIAPTLDPSYIAREINAVDSEYQAKLDDENRRANESFKKLLNSSHPASRFTVGNLNTLGHIPTDQLRTKLKNFYDSYYTSNNMVLVLVANQSLNILEGYAREYFGSIEKRSAKSLKTLPKLASQTGNIQFFKTKTEKNIVKFTFPIPSQTLKYASQPTRYISYVLGDESSNSLFSDLKNNGWAQSLHVGLQQDDRQHALLTVSMSLTDDGVAQRNQVAARLFKAIENLRNTPINQHYLDEIGTLSQLNYHYRDYSQPIRMAQILASRSVEIAPKHLLNSFHITQKPLTEELTALLDMLRKDNLIVQWQSNSTFPENWAGHKSDWLHEPLYQGEYRNQPLSADWPFLASASFLSSHYGLPDANPYMPQDLTVRDSTDDAPVVIMEDANFNVWYRSNTRYEKPNGMIFGYFGLLENANQRDCLTMQLWARLFSDSVNETTYQPFMAGLGYKLYPHRNGLTLKTNGYSDKQGEYFKTLVSELLSFRANPDRLAIAKQEVAKGLRNLESQPPYALARHYFGQVAVKGNSSTELMLQQLEEISIDEINAFIEQHINSFQFTGYMTGNFENDEAHRLADYLRTLLDEHLSPHEYQYVQLNEFEPSKRYIFPFETSSNDSTVLYSLIATDTNDASHTERAYIRVLTQLLSARFYHEFRTEKQYGYIVAVTNQTIEKTPAIGFLVQSPKISTQKLVNEIERFIDEQKWGDNVSEKEFEQARKALLAAFKKQPTNLREESSREWPHIVEPEHSFDDHDKWIDALETLDREKFLAYVNEKVEQDQCARLLITNKWHDLDIWQTIAIQ